MSSIDGSADSDGGHQNDDLESDVEVDRDESHGDHDLSDHDRPGRFYGPDSSWRFYTQGERALAASLEQAENNDLSIHLYNTHAWKQQHRDEQRIAEAKTWHSKQQWIKPDEKGKLPFLPPTAWTAWPLPPEEVPRSTEQWGAPTTAADEDTETLRAATPWKPSLHLQEEVKATFLRLAKEKFQEREWADDDHVDESVKPEPTSRSRRSSFFKPENDSDEPLDDLDRLEEQLQQESSLSSGESPEHYIPMVLDDDDAARRILQPSLRHLLSKFDHLLIALHKNRQGHYKERGGSRSRSRGSRSRSKSRAGPQSSGNAARKRKRVASDVYKQEQDDDDEAVGLSEEDAAELESVSQRDRGKYTLGTRDWSEVLGTAALVGFDRTVIDRTARRCATLFREGMTMRIMPEVASNTVRDQVTEYVPDMIPPIESESDGDISDDSSDDDDDHIYTCPHTTCARHSRPFEQQWRLNEHLKRTHKYTDGQLAAAASKQSSSSRRSSVSAAINDDESEASVELDNDESEQMVHDSADRNEFLQPISIHIGRSRDKRGRKARSESTGS